MNPFVSGQNLVYRNILIPVYLLEETGYEAIDSSPVMSPSGPPRAPDPANGMFDEDAPAAG